MRVGLDRIQRTLLGFSYQCPLRKPGKETRRIGDRTKERARLLVDCGSGSNYGRMRLVFGIVSWAMVIAFVAPTDVIGQTWEAVPSLPASAQGRVHAVGLTREGRVYATGGTPWLNGNDGDGSVHSFVPGAAAWQSEISLDGMGPVIGQGGGVDSLGRMIIFGGKNNSNGDPGETVTYDPAQGPSGGLPRRPNSAPNRYFAWCTDGQGRLYSIGGGKGREAVPNEGNVGLGWRFDASTDDWNPIAGMSSPVGDAAAVYDGNGHILVIGGVVAQGGLRSTNVASYDIAGNTWSDTAVADLPEGINGHRAVVGANGWVYVIGGEGGELLEPTMLNTVWIYRPDLNSWQIGPELAQSRRYHGAVLGPDNYIYVFGGENNGGGLVTAERLFTPPCPTVTTQPTNAQAWIGANIGLSVTVAGGAPISYQWQKGGIPLSDGPLGGGATVSGSQTASLSIENVSAEAEGQYSVVATNSCGVTQSAPATVTMLVPPNIDGPWVVTNLHPGWAEQSYATDVEGGRQVGYGVRDIPGQYNNIDLAWECSGTPESCVSHSGPGSVGGAFLGRGAGHRVGWWWWPYSCYVSGHWYTCYSKQPALLDAVDSFFNLQVSGWEYSWALDTDGTQVVGSATTDDAVGNYFSAATLWWKNSLGNWTYLQLMWPYDSLGRDSNASAVFAGKQYGSWQYRGINYDGAHACMWSGTATSLVGMEPPGSISSGIIAAHIGQQGGSASWGQGGHAALWAGTPESAKDIHPSGWASSGISDIHSGVQVGYVSGEPGTHAAAWIGTAVSLVDLHAFLPPEFLTSTASGVEVDADEVITVVGSGFNTATQRNEALMWRANAIPECVTDANCDDGLFCNGGETCTFARCVPGKDSCQPGATCDETTDTCVVPGDCNRDGVVNLVDHLDFESCLSGPADSLLTGCSCFDLDGDGAITLIDFATVQVLFGGP